MTRTALASQVLAVVTRAGIAPEAFDDFDPAAYRTEQGAAASLDSPGRHNRQSLKSYSGIWHDLPNGKRRTKRTLAWSNLDGHAQSLRW